MSFSKISIIISREYTQRVKKKSFIITTLLMPLFLAMIMILPGLMAMHNNDEIREIVVVENGNKISSQLQNTEKVTFKFAPGLSYQEAEQQNGNSFGFLIIGDDIIENPSSMQLYTRQSSTIGLENDITRQVSNIIESERISRANIPNLDSVMQAVKARASLTTFVINEQQGSDIDQGKSSSSMLSMSLGYIGGFLIYMFIFLYGTMVLQGVIEEKNSRIIEVIVSSVKPFQLMMGKILGIAFVALTQLVIWIVLFFIISIVAYNLILGGAQAQAGEVLQAAQASGISGEFGAMLGGLNDVGYMMGVLVSYIIYFIGGYLLYASMFAAVGSAVDNIQDAQQLQTPITLPLILSIIILLNVMQNPDSAVAFWFSMIPFTSPIVMMARIPYGVPFWEIALSLVLLYGSFVFITWVSAKIYRTGIFMYGKKPTLKELIKWARYKS